jgi:hypothetical protein
MRDLLPFASTVVVLFFRPWEDESKNNGRWDRQRAAIDARGRKR